jgi:hypothetical protein
MRHGVNARDRRPITVEASSGNMFEDVGRPNAAKRLAYARP